MPPTPIIGIIDDDASVRAAMESLVRSLGYRVESFASAEAFLAGDGSARVACIICDIILPGQSGIDLLNRMATSPGTPPVILVTALRNRGLHARVRRGGARWLLVKPCGADTLQACLREALAG